MITIRSNILWGQSRKSSDDC